MEKSPIMLSDYDIRRRILAIRHSSRTARYGRHIPSMNALAKAAGIARETLHRIVNGAPIGPRARAGLSRALTFDAMTGERNAGR